MSICPECHKTIEATLYTEDGKVYITKICQEHGQTTDLYWGDTRQYRRAEKYAKEGVTLHNPQTRHINGCPYDCGICPNHRSTTILGVIDVTNRCNLRCPICFAHAGTAGYLYEPTLNQIKDMMMTLLANKPVWTPALQLSGGEPTIREDLPEIVEMAKKLGFIHVELNTNGLKLAESQDYCKMLKRIRINPVFSFKPVSQAESSAEAHINHPQTRPKTRNHRPEPQEPPTTRPSSTQ